MPKRKCVFSDKLKEKFTCFKSGRHENEAECLVCPPGTYVSVANKGALDLEAHQKSTKHNSNLQTVASSSKIDTFFDKRDSKVIDLAHAAEGALAFHTVKHHQSFKSMDCTNKLQRVLFKDSSIAKHISCAQTKTKSVIDSVLSPHSIDVTVEVLSGISCIGVSTDGSNHGSIKLFPVLIQYFDVKSGGIQTKVLELKSLPNETSETIAKFIIESLKSKGIERKCVAFSGDNTNTNFGGIGRGSGKNVFTYLKTNLSKENLVGVGCPAHVLHNCVQHGIDSGLSFDVDSIVMKIFNYFSIYTVRTESLKEFCGFVDIQYRVLLSHSKTRWLSLFPCVTRILQMYPALKSFFMSQEQIPIIIKNFFEDELSECRLWFVHSLMSIFHQNILSVEKEQNTLADIMYIFDKTTQTLKDRKSKCFKPLKVSEILKNKKEEGLILESNVNQIESEISVVYSNSLLYLEKWMTQYENFHVFNWMKVFVSRPPSWEDVEPTLIRLSEVGIQIDDAKCFDQFCNFLVYLNKKHEELKNKGEKIEGFEVDKVLSTNDIWLGYFNSSPALDCHSELLKIAQYFFAIPSNNSNVERLFSLINVQWTKERNKLKVETVKGLLCVKHNFKNFTCTEFHSYLLKNKKLLDAIGSSTKYEHVQSNESNDSSSEDESD